MIAMFSRSQHYANPAPAASDNAENGNEGRSARFRLTGNNNRLYRKITCL